MQISTEVIMSLVQSLTKKFEDARIKVADYLNVSLKILFLSKVQLRG